MTVTLYLPDQFPQPVELLPLADGIHNSAPVFEQVATLLKCHLSLVDVLAAGSGYVIYSVFDSEDSLNLPAMAVASSLTGVLFDQADDDIALRGPVLVVTGLQNSSL